MSSNARAGIYIMLSALVALTVCNVGFDNLYDLFWSYIFYDFAAHPITPRFFINECLMVIFFFSITLEIKYEYLYGVLESRASRVLPAVCALAGMIGPAVIYLGFERGAYISGWAIPVATDIAFSLACLMLVGKLVPPAARIFLLSLAVFDDLGAILIIALYFSGGFSWLLLFALIAAIMYLALISRMNAHGIWQGLGLLGLWVICFLGSVHTTLAGVMLAAFYPMKQDIGLRASNLMHALDPYIVYIILPIFAFANAGVALADVNGMLFSPVAQGIALGLLIGKPVAITFVGWACVKLGWARYPQGMNTTYLLGISFLCGIGFTMSLFIAALAFKGQDAILDVARISVIGASVLAGLAGIVTLRMVTSKTQSVANTI